MRTFLLGAAAIALLMADSGAPFRVWTGFSRVAAEGGVHSADLLVGSTERKGAARPLELVVWLGATDAKGKSVCTALTEVETRLQPEPARPLRFTVTYPAGGGPETSPSTYKLFAKVHWKTAGARPKEGIVENVMTVSVPAGGTPACVEN